MFCHLYIIYKKHNNVCDGISSSVGKKVPSSSTFKNTPYPTTLPVQTITVIIFHEIGPLDISREI
jgi:hypothetical protein